MSNIQLYSLSNATARSFINSYQYKPYLLRCHAKASCLFYIYSKLHNFVIALYCGNNEIEGRFEYSLPVYI